MTDEIKTTAEAIEAAALINAYSAVVGPDQKISQPTPKLPDCVTKKPVEKKSPAEWAYERIVMYIQNFEEQLDSEQEVAMAFASGGSSMMRIQGMGYFAPDIITFYGEDDNGAKSQLVQHISQLNVILQSAPKLEEDGEPYRIGFKLFEDLNQKDG